MSETAVIDGDRLWSDLTAMGAIGGTAGAAVIGRPSARPIGSATSSPVGTGARPSDRRW